jgi:hypothetical protein
MPKGPLTSTPLLAEISLPNEAAELERTKDEKKSIEQCLAICTQALEHVNEVQPSFIQEYRSY